MKNPMAVNFGADQASSILFDMFSLVGVKSSLKLRVKTVSTKKHEIPNEMKLVKASLESSLGSERGMRATKQKMNAQSALPPHVSWKAFGRSAPNF